MSRYFLELTYKGTAYSGFQVQENAATVQSELEKALQVLFREPFSLTGSSRTDAGVHANQNFFHFDTEIAVTNRNVYNLNAILPPDIAVRGIYPVPEAAHCRFDAVARQYKYYIFRHKNPFLADRGWLYPYPLEMEALQRGADIIRGYRDFTSFSKRNTQVNNFNCTIETAQWHREQELLVFEVKANRFLRGMVRGLVGTLLKLGRGQISEAELVRIIEARDCSQADFTTPAQGLFLHRVFYNDQLGPLLTAAV